MSLSPSSSSIDSSESSKEPTINQKFKSLEEVEEFLNQFAATNAFSIRLSRVRRDESKEVIARTFVCSCAGYPVKKKKEPQRNRESFSFRCGCPWTVNVRKRDDYFYISTQNLTHNHSLTVSKLHRRGLTFQEEKQLYEEFIKSTGYIDPDSSSSSSSLSTSIDPTNSTDPSLSSINPSIDRIPISILNKEHRKSLDFQSKSILSPTNSLQISADTLTQSTLESILQPTDQQLQLGMLFNELSSQILQFPSRMQRTTQILQNLIEEYRLESVVDEQQVQQQLESDQSRHQSISNASIIDHHHHHHQHHHQQSVISNQQLSFSTVATQSQLNSLLCDSNSLGLLDTSDPTSSSFAPLEGIESSIISSNGVDSISSQIQSNSIDLQTSSDSLSLQQASPTLQSIRDHHQSDLIQPSSKRIRLTADLSFESR